MSRTECKPPLDREPKYVPLYINKQAGNMTVFQEIVPTHTEDWPIFVCEIANTFTKYV